MIVQTFSKELEMATIVLSITGVLLLSHSELRSTNVS